MAIEMSEQLANSRGTNGTRIFLTPWETGKMGGKWVGWRGWVKADAGVVATLIIHWFRWRGSGSKMGWDWRARKEAG